MKYSLKSNIHQWLTKFQAFGTIHNLNYKAESPKSEIKNTAKNSENFKAIRKAISIETVNLYRD